MSDLIQRLRIGADEIDDGCALCEEAADEIERLQELIMQERIKQLMGPAERYWEARWRDTDKELDAVRKDAATAWDKCEERRLEGVHLREQLEKRPCHMLDGFNECQEYTTLHSDWDRLRKENAELHSQFVTAKAYVEKAIASFDGDPADNQFQRGFLAAMKVVRDEAFSHPDD